MHKDGLTIAFTGGGTGGHVTPIVSLIEYAQKHSEISAKCKQLYRFGEIDSLEEQAAQGLLEVVFVPILAGKLRRYRDVRSTLHNIQDGVKVVAAFFQSLRWLSRYKIDVVFCKGGYVSLPVCRAARVLGKKVFLHESDMHAGLTNRVVSKFADTCFVCFSDTFGQEEVVGQILSSHLLDYDHDKVDAKTQVLVMGGSQGSQALLAVMDKVLDKVDKDKIHITIILGTKNLSWGEKLKHYLCVSLYEYVDQSTLASIYAQTDVAITRAGVTSLAEQQLFGIKKIIIPHPHGGGYHQLYNALRYSEMYEDIVVEENEQLQENVEMFVDKLVGWKKDWKGINGAEVEKAKGVIWERLIS